jgi:hypothetical protein
MASRGCVLASAFVLLVSACAQPARYDATLSPAENDLRQASDRFNLTVAQGVGVGALLGAVTGALVSRDHLTGALVGGAAGAALGGGAGYLVARNNAGHAHTEADYRHLIATADEDAATYSRSAAASRQIAASARTEAAALDQAYQERRVTAAQYKISLSRYGDDAEMMRAQIKDADQRAIAMRGDASAAGPADQQRLLASAAQITQAREELARSADQISATLAARPQGVT